MIINNIMCAGIDAGNGVMKNVVCVPDSGESTFITTKFPMIYYPGEERPTAEWDDNKQQEDALDVVVQFDGEAPQHYFFGSLAATYPGVDHIFNPNKVEDNALKSAIYVSLAIKQSTDKQTYYVCTGTPYKDYIKMKDVFANQLPDTCQITFKAGPLRGTIKTVKILAALTNIQGYGIFINETNDERGNIIRRELGNGEVAIVDIGQGTTNLIYIKDGVPVASGCDTLNGIAMKTVYDALSKELFNKFGENVEGAQIIDIYNKAKFTYEGVEYDLRDEGLMAKAKMALAKLIQDNVKKKWPHYKMFKTIMIGGGGGAAIGNLFKIQHKQVINDQFANAKGYLKTIIYKVNKDKQVAAANLRKAD